MIVNYNCYIECKRAYTPGYAQLHGIKIYIQYLIPKINKLEIDF